MSRTSQLKNVREATKTLRERLGDEAGQLYDSKEGDKVLWYIQTVDDILEQYNVGQLDRNGMMEADACTVYLNCLRGTSREIIRSACLTTKGLTKNLQISTISTRVYPLRKVLRLANFVMTSRIHDFPLYIHIRISI